ncbi:hypothetical protein GCM10010442_77600 [Kitasatospora kifunensis]
MADGPGLTRLTGNGSGECGQNDCPNVYATDRGSFVVQGDVFNGLASHSTDGSSPRRETSHPSST